MSARSIAVRVAASSVLALTACPHEGESPPTSATEATSDTEPGATASTASSTSTTSSPSTSSDIQTESASTDPTASSTTDASSTSTSTTALDTSTGEPDTTTAAPPGVCGDGVLDPGEECDDGGDNANNLYDGCTLACTLGPRCKDALVQLEHEECDPLDPNLVDEAACTDACTWGGRIVFVSGSTYTGALGGLAGADATCRALAKSAGLSDHLGYRAWLSVGPVTAAARIGDTGEPFILLDGQPIAPSFASLTAGNLLHPIDLTELQAPVQAPLGARTNTATDGSTASLDDDCAAWTTGVGPRGVGGVREALDGDVVEVLGPYFCSKQRHLYCVGP